MKREIMDPYGQAGRENVRRFPRYNALGFDCDLQTGRLSAFIFGHPNRGLRVPIYEIGEGGFGMVSRHRLRPNRVYRFSLYSLYFNGTITGSVLSRFCVPGKNGDGAYRVGFKFLKVERNGKNALRQLMETRTFQDRKIRARAPAAAKG